MTVSNFRVPVAEVRKSLLAELRRRYALWERNEAEAADVIHVLGSYLEKLK